MFNKNLALVFIAASLTSVSITSAEEVQFESAPYYCKKFFAGEVTGNRQCTMDATVEDSACDRLDRYESEGYYAKEDADVLKDARSAQCGRRTIRELLSEAEHARYEAMSYVTAGEDESRCDPETNPVAPRCNQTWYAVYNLYMCAAARCKFAR
ncbi:hypothetical protein [Methylocystis sp. SB2]|uniref:hypothetical protein n=1 Tax=Methylocystis sp. (strain SB2) TaxID=743836 RepID=UPI0012EDE83D|nr:hypothetical protein [Methylocystis sp. SB2]ULO24240.1 hypothetical protein LNB28_02180 [Methylocystis sp. SB2]